MNPELQSALAELARSLGTTTEYLWGVLIRQAPISGAFDLLAVAVSLGFVAAAVLFILRLSKARTGDLLDDIDFFMPAVFAAVFALGALTVAVSFGYDAATAFNNPAFWALKEVLDSVGS